MARLCIGELEFALGVDPSIDPINLPSKKLFEKTGFENISEKEGKTINVGRKTAVQDHYKLGWHFMVYEKHI